MTIDQLIVELQRLKEEGVVQGTTDVVFVNLEGFREAVQTVRVNNFHSDVELS